jgi:hypothetical protein
MNLSPPDARAPCADRCGLGVHSASRSPSWTQMSGTMSHLFDRRSVQAGLLRPKRGTLSLRSTLLSLQRASRHARRRSRSVQSPSRGAISRPGSGIAAARRRERAALAEMSQDRCARTRRPPRSEDRVEGDGLPARRTPGPVARGANRARRGRHCSEREGPGVQRGLEYIERDGRFARRDGRRVRRSGGIAASAPLCTGTKGRRPRSLSLPWPPCLWTQRREPLLATSRS